MDQFEQDHSWREQLRSVAAQHRARPFLAELEERGTKKTVRLHTIRNVASAAQRRALATDMRKHFADTVVRVEAHSDRVFHGQKSLEGFGRVAKGEILFDPTGAISRAKALAAYARALRSVFGRRIEGVFWTGEWRTLYVIFNAKRVLVDGKVKVEFLAEAEVKARELLNQTMPADDDFVSAIRLGFEAPEFPVIPVDAKSALLNQPLIATLRHRAGMSAIAAVFGLTAMGTASAADMSLPTKYGPPVPAGLDPAVSAVNGKIAIMGGSVKNAAATNSGNSLGGNSEGVFIGAASVSVPVAHSLGFQVDAAAGRAGNDHTFWGLGAHAFWRDPAKGLLGIIGSYSSTKQDALPGPTLVNRSLGRFGAEGELYLDQFTVAAQAGYQWADVGGATSSSGSTTKSGGFGSVDLTWYATPDFALSVGGEYSNGIGGRLTGGIEYQPSHLAMSGLTFFADGAVGSGSHRALAGLRYYFGTGSKSLINRHRQDDPSNLVTDSFGGIQQSYFQ